MFQGPLDDQFTFCITFETNNLVFDETVDERQRETCHVEGGIDLSFTFILIVTAQSAEFLVVEHEVPLNSVGIVLLHQIY